MEHYDRCSILRLRIAWFAISPIIPIAGISVEADRCVCPMIPHIGVH